MIVDDLDRAFAFMKAQAEAAWQKGDLEGFFGWLGRNDAPGGALDLLRSGQISIEDLRPHLCHLWCGAEYPCRCVPSTIWIEWFRGVGFVSDSDRSAPTAALEVWRSNVGRCYGLSWTTDREQAMWFHERNMNRTLASELLHGVVPPSEVLAMIDGRDEHEVVIDPRTRFWRRKRR